MNDELQTQTQADPAEPDPEPPEIPMIFTVMVWMSIFAVILWFMLRIFGRK